MIDNTPLLSKRQADILYENRPINGNVDNSLESFSSIGPHHVVPGKERINQQQACSRTLTPESTRRIESRTRRQSLEHRTCALPVRAKKQMMPAPPPVRPSALPLSCDSCAPQQQALQLPDETPCAPFVSRVDADHLRPQRWEATLRICYPRYSGQAGGGIESEAGAGTPVSHRPTLMSMSPIATLAALTG